MAWGADAQHALDDPRRAGDVDRARGVPSGLRGVPLRAALVGADVGDDGRLGPGRIGVELKGVPTIAAHGGARPAKPGERRPRRRRDRGDRRRPARHAAGLHDIGRDQPSHAGAVGIACPRGCHAAGREVVERGAAEPQVVRLTAGDGELTGERRSGDRQQQSEGDAGRTRGCNEISRGHVALLLGIEITVHRTRRRRRATPRRASLNLLKTSLRSCHRRCPARTRPAEQAAALSLAWTRRPAT
jgi:hypothetical protein